jgi:NADPH-dependent ferric siderophore reductase
MSIDSRDPLTAVGGPRIVRVRHESVVRRELTVQDVEPLSPKMLRVTLGGEPLEGFTSLGFDDHVKLIFAPSTAERGSTPLATKPPMRDFTPRRFDMGARRLVIDFAIHEAGIATAWASSAEPGQSLSVGGPRGSFIVPTDIGCHVLVGDETALPAIGRRLEELPAGTQAIVVAEIDTEADELVFTSKANVNLQWVYRRGVRAGAPDGILRALQLISLPTHDVFAWAAAESKVARAVRHYLVTERGLDKQWIKAAGYWQSGSVGTHDKIAD